MIKLVGVLVSLAVSLGAAASPSHTDSPNPELEEQIEESYGDPAGIMLPEVQVVRFLGQHFPEMLGELEKVQEPEQRKMILDRARGLILEWEEHQRVGDEVAANFIMVERTHYQNDSLVEKYVKMEEGEEKKALGDEIRGNLGKILDARMEMERAELVRLTEEIAAIESNIEDASANRETMLETEMRDLLEFWRLKQAGETVGRDRERPLIPADPTTPGTEGTPVIPKTIGEKPGERVEVARPVAEGAGGGFVDKDTPVPVKPELVEDPKVEDSPEEDE